MDRNQYESDLSARINDIAKVVREDHSCDQRGYYPGEIEKLKREAEEVERKLFRAEHEQSFPRTLYEWEFPAGQGYFCRIVETQPGIVRFEQAPRPEDGSDLFWMATDRPMGCANEMISLHNALLEAEDELADYENSLRNAAAETCGGDEKHCSCVGLLRREVRELSAAKSLNARIAADAIANRERDEKRHRIEMENERNRFAAHLSEVDRRAENAALRARVEALEEAIDQYRLQQEFPVRDYRLLADRRKKLFDLARRGREAVEGEG